MYSIDAPSRVRILLLFIAAHRPLSIMSVVDEIKQKLDLVDLVSQTVKLRKSGRSYAGLCPFHSNTRTPAFYVFPETQTWHCFGACGMGGDIFTFVMKKDNVDFGDALRHVGGEAGVPTAS